MQILAHVDLVVRNMERSLAFYVGCLGCSIAVDTQIDGPGADFYSGGTGSTMRLVLLQLNVGGKPFGGMIELLEPSGELATPPEPRPRGYGIRNFTIAVESLSASLAELSAKGVVPWRETIVDLTQRGQGKIAFIADPDGNWIELVEPQRQVVVDGPAPSVFSEAEQRQLFAHWNDTGREYPSVLIHEMFERQAAATPARTALVFEGQSLTYAELNARSNQLARHLQKLDVGPETLVGIAMERSIEMIVSLYAVLKAGAAYVPLDPGYPKERLEYMVGDARPRIVLIQERLRATLPFGDGLAIDSAWPEIARERADNLGLSVRPENLAYVIYTSGSTGRPKGAMNIHAGIANRLQWMQEQYRLTPEDRVLHKTPFSFDVSVWELFWPLMYGARLVVAKPRGHQDPSYLVDTIVNEGITTLHFVPPMLAVFLEAETVARCTTLRCVVASGEALPYNLVVRFRERLGAALHNLYGPTEASVDVSHWTCELGGSVVPIGRPIANLRLHILDTNLEPVPLGAEGEIHIAGVGLARGYLARPGLTAERFVPDPFSPAPGGRLYQTGDLGRQRPDGVIEYLGRNDHQVKIRGFRIELGEIEARLAQHATLREVVVIAREDAPGDKRLVAYVVGKGAVPAAAELRAHLESALPAYMVPSAFVVLDKLPLTPNGKVDRKALPEPERGVDARAHDAAQGPLEQTLVRIWSKLLQIEHVGRNDDFFELGGHSLLAMDLIARVREALEVELPIDVMFEARTTVASLARVVEQVASAAMPGNAIDAEPDLSIVALGQADGPTVQVQRYFFKLNEVDPTISFAKEYVAWRISGPLDCDVLARAMRVVVERHQILRSNFERRGTNVRQLVRRAEPPHVPELELDDQSAHANGVLTPSIVEQSVRPIIERTFDVEHGALVYSKAIRLRHDEHVVITAMPHVVFDAASWYIYSAELGTAYRALLEGVSPADMSRALGDLPFQFLDVATRLEAHTASAAGRAALDVWRRKMDGAPPLVLPADFPRDAVDAARTEAERRGPSNNHVDQYCAMFPAGVVSVSADAAFADAAIKLIERERATPLAFLLTGIVALLHGETEQTDIAFNTNVGTRPLFGADQLIGPFHNQTFVRADLSSRPTYRQLLAATRGDVVEMLRYGTIPVLESVPHHVGRLGVNFAGMNVQEPIVQLRDARTTILPPWPSSAVTHFDFQPMLDLSSRGLTVDIIYNERLFRHATVERLAARYLEILRSIVTTPDARAGSPNQK
ncbi:MAG: non-ribosomal peptide synthetase/polyketide synthase [Myxococcales bacterium]|nr:non-ribosomal peptide synthetase/polyketide synthase [Myxococcales bacterium]